MSTLSKARAALEVAERLADGPDDGWRLRAYAAGLDLAKHQQTSIDYAIAIALLSCAESLERIASAMEASA
jgi:hypothetical protein